MLMINAKIHIVAPLNIYIVNYTMTNYDLEYLLLFLDSGKWICAGDINIQK